VFFKSEATPRTTAVCSLEGGRKPRRPSPRLSAQRAIALDALVEVAGVEAAAAVAAD